MSNDIQIDNFPKLRNIEDELKATESKWIFRAEKYFDNEDDWLRTSIQKAFRQYEVGEKDKTNTEKDLIREFQRKLHLYSNNPPVRNDITQWLALMQHYGAPTRLLDWTYSFWVAVFLAIARKEVGDKTVIWALNTDAEAIKKEITNVEELGVDETIKKIIKNDKSLTYCDKTSINDCAVVFSILENKKDGIYIINPFRLNDRLTIQQGVFVIPCNIKKSFMGNLNIPEKTKSELLKKYVLEIDSKFQKDLLSHLRQMNINSAVLFPGLQGFAESLWMRAGCTMTGKLWNKDIEEKLQLYTDQ